MTGKKRTGDWKETDRKLERDLGGEIDLHPVELFTFSEFSTNMIFICHQHGKLSRQRQHRRMIGKEYGTKQ